MPTLRSVVNDLQGLVAYTVHIYVIDGDRSRSELKEMRSRMVLMCMLSGKLSLSMSEFHV